VVAVVLVPPNARLPSLHPVTAQAFEFNLPAVVGFGSNPAPLNAVEGLEPTAVVMELLKSIVKLGDPFVTLTCPKILLHIKKTKKNNPFLIIQFYESKTLTNKGREILQEDLDWF
jgi:hypothetical protein